MAERSECAAEAADAHICEEEGRGRKCVCVCVCVSVCDMWLSYNRWFWMK